MFHCPVQHSHLSGRWSQVPRCCIVTNCCAWCPPGFLYSTDTNNCECYPNPNVVCNEQRASLNFASCMTYEEGEGSFLGLCISFLAHGRNVSNRLYFDLPGNLTGLNDYMCGRGVGNNTNVGGHTNRRRIGWGQRPLLLAALLGGSGGMLLQKILRF